MATVKLSFRGPCLFVWRRPATGKRATSIDVILPNAARGGQHLDGSPATPHWAYICDMSDPQRWNRSLLGVDVALAGSPETGFDEHSPDLFWLPEFVPTTNSPNKDFHTQLKHQSPLDATGKVDLAVACRLRLTGGSIAYKPSQYMWKVGASGKKAAALEVVWDTGLQDLTVEFSKGEEHKFSASPTGVVVGNVCQPDPRVWDDVSTEKALVPQMSVDDHDFKWLYRLFEPADANKSWGDFLHTPGSPFVPLPVPWTDGTPAPGRRAYVPNVSTCFGGGWGEPPD
jgi:hypothetical protein